MQQTSFKITYKTIFYMLVFILLVSRILVLTNNYDWFIDPVMLEVIYLFLTVIIVLAHNRGNFAVHKGKGWLALGLLLAHTILWGVVFVDSRMAELISSHFKSQIMFVVILFVTVWAIMQMQIEQQFLKCGYYALALVMFVQLITNYSEIDLSNLANIFTAQDRTRANFGFGHYNALGGACVTVIMMQEYLRKYGRNVIQKTLDMLILIMVVVMLLCSASRSAITGLILYFILYYGTQLNRWNIAPVLVKAIKVVRVFAILLLIVWGFFGLDTDALLVAAQRALLFNHTVPMFFETGKVMLGLGYASTVAYAYNQTPYTTLWMDNAYIYYMITTGFVGLAILMIAFFIIGKGVYKNRKTKTGAVVFTAFAVYAYISLFEVNLFNSGSLLNYIYIPWFIVSFAQTNKGERLNGQRV